MISKPPGNSGNYCSSPMIRRQWLTADTFLLVLERPPALRFTAGQRIRLFEKETARDYSLIPGDRPAELMLLIRAVPGGSLSTHLAHCPPGTRLLFQPPNGHFIYRSASRPAVFIATGTGVAPFAAMCREGIRPFALLHGVRNTGALFDHELLAAAADHYVPCLSGTLPPSMPGAFQGRVTAYIEQRLPTGNYDFYLAGRHEMIADVMAIVDDRFPSSRVYTEIFY